MRAITFYKYGSADVLQEVDLPKPEPKDNEVLIKIHAVGLNPLDWRKMSAEPFLVRLGEGLFKPKHNILGADVAGVVEAVGKDIKEYEVGDEVFGDISYGGLAEFVCTTEDKIALKPINVTFEEAAAVPVAATTSLQGLRDNGNIKVGQKVLINGASGGLGTYAVQIAKYYGAEVTAVSSAKNHKLVQSIGANELIDYTKEDFTKSGEQYDLIYDAIGNISVSGLKRSLRRNGLAVVAGFTTMGHLLAVGFGGKKISMLSAKAKQNDLIFLADLMQKGKVKSIIDRLYSLTDAPEAMAYLQKGHAKGKVVIAFED